ncbi:MAG: NifB/NifX family molybdenum-iron cluster-binding protein [Clostridia bacterium]|nr:NifB/NifX family molybdenum-iron cluster-binding protein [Clostridia bacterium]
MIIAATHENGEIFRHFGQTQTFKIYETHDGVVSSARIVPTNGAGHGALAGFLKENGVSVVICGGIGEGARNALTEQGIAFVSGAKGNADAAIAAYLAGELKSAGVNCGHHHGAGHVCGTHGCKHE